MGPEESGRRGDPRLAELIDSSVIVAVERLGRPPGELWRLYPGARPFVSAITASELLVGLHFAATPDQRERRRRFIEALLAAVPVAPFNLGVARIHSELIAQLRPAGVVIGAHDLLVAATAMAGDHEVVTANLREFERIPGLRVRRLVF